MTDFYWKLLTIKFISLSHVTTKISH
jgi:hypothetical protein